MCMCVCCYMCLCVWILMQNNFKLIWDWAQSNLLFSFVGFPAQPLFFFFFFGLTALPLDFVLKECGHYHYLATRQIFSQHVCSMNILLILYLSALMSLILSLDRISCVIFFSQIKEMSQSQGISYLSVQKIQGYKV